MSVLQRNGKVFNLCYFPTNNQKPIERRIEMWILFRKYSFSCTLIKNRRFALFSIKMGLARWYLKEPSIPLPLDPFPLPEADEKRLWIGNIDSRLTEYNLLKIVQQFGKIKRFDFLFHKSGVLKGQPRGYSFVTYESRAQAEKALVALNGKPVLGKDLAVKWAHTAPSESTAAKKAKQLQSEKSLEETKETKNSIQQIMAIEQKLKAMDEQRDKELEMCLSAVSSVDDDSFLASKKNTVLSYHKPRSVPYHRDKKQFGSRKR